jgi:hypothetical protein
MGAVMPIPRKSGRLAITPPLLPSKTLIFEAFASIQNCCRYSMGFGYGFAASIWKKSAVRLVECQSASFAW